MIKCIVFLFVMILAHPAMARDYIHVVGSSTVFPFIAAAAEQFGRATEFRTPIVEATGTGGGVKMFCEGIGQSTPDMVNASRQIKPAEIADCKKNGISEIIEIKIGYDGIVFVTSVDAPDFALTKEILFLALARDIPRDGALITNPYTRWNQIDKTLPDIAIEVYGPPPTSGTRDAFAELVMGEGCKKFPEYAKKFSNPDDLKQHCQGLREDGVFIEAGENDNLIVQKLSSNANALAIFGYSFLEQNAAVVKAHPVGDVEPSFEAIVAGEYTVSRSLFTYIKKAHVNKVAGLSEFTLEITSDAAVGNDGYLILKGLLPLPKAEHDVVKQTAKNLTPMAD